MPNTYSIGLLAACECLREDGFPHILTNGYECEEGKADIVCLAPDDSAVLVFVTTKRVRGEIDPAPNFNAKKLARVARCFLVDHPCCKNIACDVMEVHVGNGATATVTCAKGAFTWESEG